MGRWRFALCAPPVVPSVPPSFNWSFGSVNWSMASVNWSMRAVHSFCRLPNFGRRSMHKSSLQHHHCIVPRSAPPPLGRRPPAGSAKFGIVHCVRCISSRYFQFWSVPALIIDFDLLIFNADVDDDHDDDDDTRQH